LFALFTLMFFFNNIIKLINFIEPGQINNLGVISFFFFFLKDIGITWITFFML
jgi:hypothetical protein